MSKTYRGHPEIEAPESFMPCKNTTEQRANIIGHRTLELFGCGRPIQWFIDNFMSVRDDTRLGTPNEFWVQYKGQYIIGLDIHSSGTTTVFTLDKNREHGAVRRFFYENNTSLLVPAHYDVSELGASTKVVMVLLAIFPELKRFVLESSDLSPATDASFLRSLPFEDYKSRKIIESNEQKVSKHIQDMCKKFIRTLEEAD